MAKLCQKHLKVLDRTVDRETFRWQGSRTCCSNGSSRAQLRHCMPASPGIRQMIQQSVASNINNCDTGRLSRGLLYVITTAQVALFAVRRFL
jgi:hypothetical protein